MSPDPAVEAETQNMSSSGQRTHLETWIATPWPTTTASNKSLYSTLPNECTRLLTLVAYDGEHMRCHLDTYHRDQAPKYDALSYCWGESVDTTAIYCNDRVLQIRTNLSTALKHIWKGAALPTQPLWVDAMCLNQDDDDEKAHQVPRMGQIYSSAAQTLIWLGEAAHDSDAAMTFLNTCHQSRRNGDSLKVGLIIAILLCDLNFMERDLPKLDPHILENTFAGAKEIARTFTDGGDSIVKLLDDIQQLLRDPADTFLEIQVIQGFSTVYNERLITKPIQALVLRPWFSRLWVLQEVVLSPNRRVICGDVSIDWSALTVSQASIPRYKLIGVLMAQVELENLPKHGIDRNILSRHAYLFQLSRLFSITQYNGGECLVSFLTVLGLSESTKCQEPVDRMWAMLAIFPEPLQQLIRQANIIDYTVIGKQQYWKSYLSIMQLLAEASPKDSWASILWCQGLTKHPSLPSWCPDFNGKRRYIGFAMNLVQARAGFLATEDIGVDAKAPYIIRPSLLVAHGFILDVVQDTTIPAPSSESASYMEVYGEYLQQAFSLLSGVDLCGSSQNATDGICQTLSLSRGRWGKDVSERFEAVVHHAYQAWTQGTHDFPDLVERLASVEFHRSSLTGARRFFNTVDGHMGLGPPDLLQGDLLCIFRGSEVPLVLRAANMETLLSSEVHTAVDLMGHREFFHLIGDIYLHGFMSGEAFTAASRGPDRTFVLA